MDHALLQNFKHSATCVAGRWNKTFPTDNSMCTLNDEMFQVNKGFANNVSEKNAMYEKDDGKSRS